MKQLPYIQTSIAIIGYSESAIAKSELNDCFVRAVASAYEIPYDDAHKWVKENFNREHRKGTCNVITNMEKFALNNETLNNKKVKVISNLTKLDQNKLKRTTLNQFIKKYPVGTYVIIVRQHAFTLKNGFVVGNPNDSKSLKKIVQFAYEIC
jgi:hypothetical protein